MVMRFIMYPQRILQPMTQKHVSHLPETNVNWQA